MSSCPFSSSSSPSSPSPTSCRAFPHLIPPLPRLQTLFITTTPSLCRQTRHWDGLVVSLATAPGPLTARGGTRNNCSDGGPVAFKMRFSPSCLAHAFLKLATAAHANGGSFSNLRVGSWFPRASLPETETRVAATLVEGGPLSKRNSRLRPSRAFGKHYIDVQQLHGWGRVAQPNRTKRTRLISGAPIDAEPMPSTPPPGAERQ